MSDEKRAPIRFGFLTALVWLVVAAGIIFVLWQVINRISTGNLPISSPTPNQTQVYQTIAALVNSQTTSSATISPQTVTPSSTSRPTLTPATVDSHPNTTSTPGSVTLTATPNVLCDLAGAGNPLDITIPDNSIILPGASFVKTWKLMNTGTCTWSTAYSVSFFYGDRMGAPRSEPLPSNVLPAQSVEISIEMVAPVFPGTYQGNWKLMNPTGELFGIGPNGDLPFWVRIIVPQNQAITATVKPSPSPTQGATPTYDATTSPSPTSTPPIQAGGKLTAAPGDAIDLDSLTMNSGNEDLLYQLDANNYHWLAPEFAAKIGVFGNQEPSLNGCQSASMSAAPIAVESLPVGAYLCYLTNEERLGRLLLEAVDPIDFILTLDLLTWANP
jgi:Ig-like domain from next to BRCA1 gene